MTHRLLALCLLLTSFTTRAAVTGESRASLVQAIITDDTGRQLELIKKLAETQDGFIEQALAAWRQGAVFLYETNDVRVPFLLDAQTDADGKAKAIRIADGEFIKDGSGTPLLFLAGELTPVDTSSRLRKAIKTTLDLFALENPDPRMRRDA